jgi:hypothetical protein
MVIVESPSCFIDSHSYWSSHMHDPGWALTSLTLKARGAPCLTIIRHRKTTTLKRDHLSGKEFIGSLNELKAVGSAAMLPLFFTLGLRVTARLPYNMSPGHSIFCLLWTAVSPVISFTLTSNATLPSMFHRGGPLCCSSIFQSRCRQAAPATSELMKLPSQRGRFDAKLQNNTCCQAISSKGELINTACEA